MKNKIKWQGLALILSLVFTFIASCDNGDEETPEQPQARTAEKIEFGTDLYTNVSCEKPLLNAEWTAVKTKLTTALDSASKTVGTTGDRCNNLFDGSVPIDLVVTTEFSYYKFVTPKILLNANYVIDTSADDLSEKIKSVVNAIYDTGLAQQ
jgi:hypothetical protein